MTGRPRSIVKARDPLIRHLLDAVDASPLTDSAILAQAGCDHGALHRLRSGERSGNVTTLASIAGALGYDIRLARRE